MKRLIIIRGPSGSGKSTTARKIQKNSIFEADDYFTERSGEYKFRPERLGTAHQVCQDNVRSQMEYEDPQIIVSNTSITIKEIQPYLDLASEFGYEVKVYRTKGPWDAHVLAARSIHGVSAEGIKRQINRYQSLENEEEYDGN